MLVGLLGLHIGLSNGELRGRIGLCIATSGSHLGKLRLALFHGAAGGCHGCAIGGHGGVLGFGGGGHLVELLLRNFFVLDQHVVARQVGLGLGGVGLRLGETRDGGFAIALGNSDAGFRVGHVGFGAADNWCCSRFRDGDVGLLRGHLAAGLGKLGAGLIDGHLEIARIEIHQRIARLARTGCLST